MSTEALSNNISNLVDTFDDNSSLIELYLAASSYTTESLLEAAVGENATELLSTVNGLGVDIGLIPNMEISELLAYNLVENYSDGFSVVSGTDETNDLIVNIADGINALSAGAGDDIVANIGTGWNILNGEDGNDFLANIGSGLNILAGGSGDDTLMNIGTGYNNLSGGSGSDTLVNIGSGTNILDGGSRVVSLSWQKNEDGLKP